MRSGARAQRRTGWGRGQGIGATYYQQKAEVPDLKAACPEYAEVHSQVLQDVLVRLDRAFHAFHAFHAFFRRLKNGEQPGYPRFQGQSRYNSFTSPPYGNGAMLDGGLLSLSKRGRIALRLHRPLVGTPKTVTISHEADGWYACISCAEVPTEPLPLTGNETGLDGGLQVFLITAEGAVVENPRHYRRAEQRLAKAQRRVSPRTQGSKRRRKAVAQLTRQHPMDAAASEDSPPAARLPPQDGAFPAPGIRHDLAGRFARGQPGPQPSSR